VALRSCHWIRPTTTYGGGLDGDQAAVVYEFARRLRLERLMAIRGVSIDFLGHAPDAMTGRQGLTLSLLSRTIVRTHLESEGS